MKVNDITVEVKAKITVDRKTAEACLKLVEMYVNETRNYIKCDRAGDGELSFCFVNPASPEEV
jgi:hypothetical protein